MAKKKEISKEIAALKKELVDGVVVIGTKSVLGLLKSSGLSKVYLAANCPAATRKDVEYYAGMAKVAIVGLALDNEEMGSLCKKQYFISVLGVKK